MTATLCAALCALLILAYAVCLGRAGRTQDWDDLSRVGEADTDGC